MSDLQNIRDNIGFQISLFFIGFVAGAIVFVSEMAVFVVNILMAALSNSFQMSELGNSIISHYYMVILVFAIVGLIQVALIGWLDQTVFSFGYILGILFMLTIFGRALWNVAQPVFIGMVIAFIFVVVGLFLKAITQNRSTNVYKY